MQPIFQISRKSTIPRLAEGIQKFYDLPAQKFAREFLTGMLISRSNLISEICRAIATSQKSFAAKYQKFWRRLSEVDFARAKEQQQNRALREIKDDTIVAIA